MSVLPRPPVLGLLPLLLAACAASPREPVAVRPEPPAPVRLTLVGTNDLHGWVMPHRAVLPDGTEVEQGGLATLSGYLAALRADNPGGVLLLDGGDLFQGTLASNLTEGRVVVQAMNALGYAAAALGNHEFDYGPVGPRSLARSGDDPFGALKVRLQEASFAMLAANLQEAGTGARPAWLGNDGTLLVERRGVRVGILGLATPSTPHVTNPVNVASLRFGPMAPAALAAARRLRARGAEVVVAVAHAGARCGPAGDPHDTSSCEPSDSEIIELAESLPEGTLDAVVAGHTHLPMGHLVRGTPIIETAGQGMAFGVVELFVDPVTRRVLRERTRLESSVPVCARVDAASGTCEERVLRRAGLARLVPATYRGHAVVPDARVEALVAPALARVVEAQQRRLGVRAAAPLPRAYEAESPLGSVLADALREVAEADVALLNSGGLRADLPAGELTFGDVYEVLPFDNTIAVVTLSSEELRRLFAAAYGAHKGVFQVSGVRVTLDACPGTARLEAVSLPGGEPLRDGQRFRVAMPDFLARGGDGLAPVLRALPPGRIDLGEGRELSFRDALVAHWQARGRPLLPPTPGRIALRGGADGCAAGVTAERR